MVLITGRSNPVVVDFGKRHHAEPVGYTLLNADGTTRKARTTTGVVAMVGGLYRAMLEPSGAGLPANWAGIILWDTGGEAPITAAEELQVDVSVASRMSATAGIASIQVVGPVSTTGEIEILAGDDYLAADGRALRWEDANAIWPDLAGATIKLEVLSENHDRRVVWAGVLGTPVSSAPGAQAITVDIPGSTTADRETAIGIGGDTYRLVAKLGTGSASVVTLSSGSFSIITPF